MTEKKIEKINMPIGIFIIIWIIGSVITARILGLIFHGFFKWAFLGGMIGLIVELWYKSHK